MQFLFNLKQTFSPRSEGNQSSRDEESVDCQVNGKDRSWGCASSAWSPGRVRLGAEVSKTTCGEYQSSMGRVHAGRFAASGQGAWLGRVPIRLQSGCLGCVKVLYPTRGPGGSMFDILQSLLQFVPGG